MMAIDGYRYAPNILIISDIVNTGEFMANDKIKEECIKIIWNSKDFQTILKKYGYIYLNKGDLGLLRDMAFTDFNMFRANVNPDMKTAKVIVLAHKLALKQKKK
jgi:hypothetical protein